MTHPRNAVALIVTMLFIVQSLPLPQAPTGPADASGSRAPGSWEHKWYDGAQWKTLTFTFEEPIPIHRGNIAHLSGTVSLDNGLQVQDLDARLKSAQGAAIQVWSNITGTSWKVDMIPTFDAGVAPEYIEYYFWIRYQETEKDTIDIYLGPSGFTNNATGDDYFKLMLTNNDYPTITHTPPRTYVWDLNQSQDKSQNVPISFDVSDKGFIKNVKIIRSSFSFPGNWSGNSNINNPPVAGTETFDVFGNDTYRYRFHSARYSTNLTMNPTETVVFYILVATDYAQCITFLPSMPKSFVDKALTSVDSFQSTSEELAAAYNITKVDNTPPPKLTIEHTPHANMSVDEEKEITAVATLTSSMQPVNMDLFFRSVGATEFTPKNMTFVSQDGGKWYFRTDLPAQSKTGEFQYYLEARAGDLVTRSPTTAPTGTHKVKVQGGFSIVATYPKDRDMNLPRDMSKTDNASITITFSSDVDPSTINAYNIKATYFKTKNNTMYQTIVAGTVTYDSASKSARFLPEQLPPATMISVFVSNRIMSLDGVPLKADYAFAFRTLPDIVVKVAPIEVLEGMDFVEGKRGMIKVYAEWPAEEPTIKSLKATVTLLVDGIEVAKMEDKEFRNAKGWSISDLRSSRDSANFDTIIYDIKFVKYPGTHELKVVVTPSPSHSKTDGQFTGTEKVTVRKAKGDGSYDILFFPLGVGNWSGRQEQDITDVAKLTSTFIQDIYPISEVNMASYSTMEPDPTNSYFRPHFRWTEYLFGDFNQFDTILMGVHSNAEITGQWEKVVVVVPLDWVNSGTSWDGALGLSMDAYPRAIFLEDYHGRAWESSEGYGVLDARYEFVPTVGAHEIGHTYGLDHSDVISDIHGYNSRKQLMINGSNPMDQTYNFMRPSPEKVNVSWIRPDDYKMLLDKLTVSPSRSGGDADNKSILVSGFVGMNSTILPMVSLDLPPDPELLTPGNVTVELLDGSGKGMASYSLTPGDVGGGQSYFCFRAARPDGLATVVLKNKGTEVARVGKSASAPTISAPTVSGPTNGNITVSWSGSDADGDNVTYSLLTSPDGTMWNTMAFDLKDTSFSFSANGLPGRSATFKVYASDGFNSASAVSAPYTISGRAPTIEILSPGPGSGPFVTTSPVPFSATAYDMDDGTLQGISILWTSSISGELGRGTDIAVLLPAGTHHIEAKATDSTGNAVTKAVDMTVIVDVPPADIEESWYFVSLEAASNQTSNGEATLTWAGAYPTGAKAVLYKDSGTGWEKLKEFDDPGLGNFTVTGLSTDEGLSYGFYIEIKASNGAVVASSMPVNVTTSAEGEPPQKPRKPGIPTGEALLVPVALATAAAMVALVRRKKR